MRCDAQPEAASHGGVMPGITVLVKGGTVAFDVTAQVDETHNAFSVQEVRDEETADGQRLVRVT